MPENLLKLNRIIQLILWLLINLRTLWLEKLLEILTYLVPLILLNLRIKKIIMKKKTKDSKKPKNKILLKVRLLKNSKKLPLLYLEIKRIDPKRNYLMMTIENKYYFSKKILKKKCV
jgi:hypothetical protein